MGKKRLKKVEKKGLKLGGQQRKITKKEEEVLNLLTKEFLTVKQASIRRGKSLTSTYKIIKKLKEKGYLTNNYQKVEKSRGTFKPLLNGIRLHALEFNVKILFKNAKYSKIDNRLLNFDGNTVKLYRDSLEVYINRSFFGESVEKVTALGFDYANVFFHRLEDYLKVILIKPRALNVSLVKAEYSEVNNELAKDVIVKGEKLKVYSRDDGKLWFLIDNSFNLFEAETVHPETSKRDMGLIVQPFFNDLRDHYEKTGEVLVLSSFLKAFSYYAENIHSHIGAIKDLTSVVRDIKDQNQINFNLKSWCEDNLKSLDDFDKHKVLISSLSEDKRSLITSWVFNRFS